MSLGHTLSLTFFCKKKKNSSSAVFLLIRVRRLHTISIGFIDDNEEFLYDSFYMYIGYIFSNSPCNSFQFCFYFSVHLFTDILNFVIQIQSVGNMKLIFAYEPYFNFGCMKYRSTVLTMYLTIVGIFYKQSTDPLVFSYLCFLAHFISAFRINDQCILTLWLRPCLYIFYKIN